MYFYPMFEYQKYRNYFAQIAGGMEKLGEEELKELGASRVEAAYRGVYFEADKETLYRINYCSRLLTRILAPLIRFSCHSDKYLYKTAYKNVPWEEIIPVDGTFAITANVSNSNITHSKYASLKLKDAIADYFRDKYDRRPSIDLKEPDVWLNLHISNNKAVISLDSSGGALHKRGYRKDSMEAPMQETLAAAIVKLSEWTGERPFYDFMCGSGTIIAEAFMLYCRIPAGFLRKSFGFMKFPDFDRSIWEKIKKDSDNKIRTIPQGLISGSDIDSKSASAARKNLKVLPGSENIRWKVCSFDEIEEGLPNTTIVTNPPYGIRLSTKEEVSFLYKSMGNFLKKKCQNSTAYVYFGDRKLIGRIGLKASRRIPLVNGSLDGRLCKYEMYAKY